MVMIHPAQRGNFPWFNTVKLSTHRGDEAVSAMPLHSFDRYQSNHSGDSGDSPEWGDDIFIEASPSLRSSSPANSLNQSSLLDSSVSIDSEKEPNPEEMTRLIQKLWSTAEKQVPGFLKKYLPKVPNVAIDGTGPGKPKEVTLTFDKPFKEPALMPGRVRLDMAIKADFQWDGPNDGSFSLYNIKGIQELKSNGKKNEVDVVQYDAGSQTFQVFGREFDNNNQSTDWVMEYAMNEK